MSRFSNYARPRTTIIDGRSPTSRTARVSGAEFDINGNMLGGRDQMTGRRVNGPAAPGGLDMAASRLGWNRQAAPSRYQSALAEGRSGEQAPARVSAPVNRETPENRARLNADFQHPGTAATNSTKPAADANGDGTPDFLTQAASFFGNAAGHAMRYAKHLFGGANAPSEGVPASAATGPEVPAEPAAEVSAATGPEVPAEPAAEVSATFNPTAAMEGEMRGAGWDVQPGELQHDGAGYSAPKKNDSGGGPIMVQPTGRMAMSVWERQNGVAGMGTTARPGQRFSEKGQAIMERTTPGVERGTYVTDGNGQRVSEGYTSRPAVAQTFDRGGNPIGGTRGDTLAAADGSVTGRAVSGAYGSGTSRFNVPAGAPVLNDGPGGQQVVTRAGGLPNTTPYPDVPRNRGVETRQTDFPRLAAPDMARPEDEEEAAKRRGRYASSVVA